MKKRVTYFDLAKGIGIILVVLGHMENIDAPIRIWIASFHMPLFFVISGMLIALKGEDSLTEGIGNAVKKKAKGILIPYFWFSLMYIPIDIMNVYINHIDSHTFVQNLLDSATFSGISVMWFLPALFIAEATALLLFGRLNTCKGMKTEGDNGLKKGIIILSVTLVMSVVLFTVWDQIRPVYDANSGSYVLCTLLGFVRVIFRGLGMTFHVAVGFVSFKVIKAIEDFIENKTGKKDVDRGLSLAAGVILSAINLSICQINGAVDNHFLLVNSMPLYFMCAILGSIGLVLVCKGLNSIKPVNFLGRNSLIIMATHLQCYLLYAGILVAIAIDAYVTRAKSYVYMFNSVLFTMLFEAIVIFVINRFFPFVTGKGSIKDLFKRKNS